jgi:hypothetical protein
MYDRKASMVKSFDLSAVEALTYVKFEDYLSTK